MWFCLACLPSSACLPACLSDPQAEELSRRLQEAQGRAQASAAEVAQLQEILDVKSDRLAALEAEAAVREQRLEELDGTLAALRAAADAGRAAAQEGQAAAGGGLQLRVAELEGELVEARSEAAVKGGSMDNMSMSRRATELMRDLAASRAQGEPQEGAIAGAVASLPEVPACSLALLMACWVLPRAQCICASVAWPTFTPSPPPGPLCTPPVSLSRPGGFACRPRGPVGTAHPAGTAAR